MELPENPFKRALREGRQQIGFWNSLPGGYVAEALAGCGFDWLLLDTEHSPSDVIDVLGKLQAVAPWPVHPMVRAAWNDVVLIKRLLDIGAQSLLIPYVQSVEEAEAAVAATRYAPRGMRGVAGGTRATRFGRVPDYWARASDEICLVVQIETVKGMQALEAIAGVDGIDGIFIGPADLGASLGHPGELDHPEVVAAVEDCIRHGARTGKAVGTLTGDPAFARRCIELGSTFTAVGIDMAVLLKGAEALARSFRSA